MSNEKEIIIFKKEVLLAEDGLFSQDYRKDLEAYAQVIQNIAIIEKGTYPNNPLLGVGIKNYLFEPYSNNLITELQNELLNQIREYAPVKGIDLDVDITYEKKVLYISFSIYRDDGRDISVNQQSLSFYLLFGLQENSNTLKSKLIVS